MKSEQHTFGTVMGASGVQGFFGEGYWFHRVWSVFGIDLSDITFVSKTATLHPYQGNMPLKENYTPKEVFPKCIMIKPFRGTVLNAVGLSNPGLPALLRAGKWQKRTEPFFISIASPATTPERRLQECTAMVPIIKRHKEYFFAPFGLQVNLSCPNTDGGSDKVTEESKKILDTLGELGVPIMMKYSIASASAKAVCAISDHPACSAICISNTIPFGWKGVDRQKEWGSGASPLKHLGGGGISGKPLIHAVCEKIKRLRDAGIEKHINGTGGILHADDVNRYHRAGASSISIGSIALLRPWNIPKVIQRANELQWHKQTSS